MSCNKQFEFFELRPDTIKVSQWNLHVVLPGCVPYHCLPISPSSNQGTQQFTDGSQLS